MQLKGDSESYVTNEFSRRVAKEGLHIKKAAPAGERICDLFRAQSRNGVFLQKACQGCTDNEIFSRRSVVEELAVTGMQKHVGFRCAGFSTRRGARAVELAAESLCCC